MDGLLMAGVLGMIVGILFSTTYAYKGLEYTAFALCTLIQVAWCVVTKVM